MFQKQEEMNMSTVIGLIILAEALLGLFIVWGFMHEDRFIRFEQKIAAKHSRAKRLGRAKRLRVVVDHTKKDDPDFSAA